MNSMTQSEYDRDIRTAYVALDAIQRLCDRGHGGLQTERCFEQIRAIMDKLESIPKRRRS